MRGMGRHNHRRCYKECWRVPDCCLWKTTENKSPIVSPTNSRDWYWVRSYFMFSFHFLLEGFPYCGESVHGCNGGFHLWSWKKQVSEHKPGHSLSLEGAQFRPWAEGHPYSTAHNLLKTRCSLVFRCRTRPKLLSLVWALSWVPHNVFPLGKRSQCGLFDKMCTDVTWLNKLLIVNLVSWWL